MLDVIFLLTEHAALRVCLLLTRNKGEQIRLIHAYRRKLDARLASGRDSK